MSWIIKRRLGTKIEFYMNVFRIDREGEFREPYVKKGINLPYEFDTMEKAMSKVNYFTKYEKPGWTYEIYEYLK